MDAMKLTHPNRTIGVLSAPQRLDLDPSAAKDVSIDVHRGDAIIAHPDAEIHSSDASAACTPEVPSARASGIVEINRRHHAQGRSRAASRNENGVFSARYSRPF